MKKLSIIVLVSLVLLGLVLTGCPQPNDSGAGGGGSDSDSDSGGNGTPPLVSSEIPDGFAGNVAGKIITLQVGSSSAPQGKIMFNLKSGGTTEGTFSVDGETLTVGGTDYTLHSSSTDTRGVYGNGSTYYVILLSGSTLFHVTPDGSATFNSIPNETTIQKATKAVVTATISTTLSTEQIKAVAYQYLLEVVKGKKFTLDVQGFLVTGTFSTDGRSLVPSVGYPISFMAEYSELVNAESLTSGEASYRAVFVDGVGKYFGALVENITVNGNTIGGTFYYIAPPNMLNFTVGYDSPSNIPWTDSTKKIEATLADSPTTVDMEYFLQTHMLDGTVYTVGGITATATNGGRTIKSTLGGNPLYDIVLVDITKEGDTYRAVYTDGYGYYGISANGNTYQFHTKNVIDPTESYDSPSNINWETGGLPVTRG